MSKGRVVYKSVNITDEEGEPFLYMPGDTVPQKHLKFFDHEIAFQPPPELAAMIGMAKKAAEEGDPFEGKSVPELRDIADKHSVDLTGVTKRKDIVEVLVANGVEPEE